MNGIRTIFRRTRKPRLTVSHFDPERAAELENETTLDQRFAAALADSGLPILGAARNRFRVQLDQQRTAEIQIGAGNWLSASAPVQANHDRDPLSLHHDWAGPVKCAANGESRVRFDLPLGRCLNGDEAVLMDRESQMSQQHCLEQICRRLPACLAGEAAPDWTPPDARQLANWLADARYEAAIDDEQHLRLVLKRKGCDGQVRVERRTGRLRFTMSLGSWNGVEAESLAAMHCLAMEANRRTRFTRIVWHSEEQTTRCCAEVDLTGLPAPDSGFAEQTWRECVNSAMAALDVALRRLGLELEALADPANRALAAAVNQMKADH